MTERADVPLEQLFERFRTRGDADALGEVFDRTAPVLLRLADRLARDASDAEDLLQATFVKAIEARDRADTQRPLMPWMIGILANQSRWRSRQARRTIDPRRLRTQEVPSADATAQSSEILERIRKDLARLPDHYRDVVQRFLLLDEQPSQIAATLGRQPSTVRMQLQRGLERLRRTLPAGIAAAAASISVPPRTLAAVRVNVLREARLAVPAAGVAAWWTWKSGVAAASALIAATIVSVTLDDIAPGLFVDPPTVATTPPVSLVEQPAVAALRDRLAPSKPDRDLALSESGSKNGTDAPPGTTRTSVETSDLTIPAVVLDGPTGDPIPHAEVYLLDPDAHSQAAIQASQQRTGDSDQPWIDLGTRHVSDLQGSVQLPALDRPAKALVVVGDRRSFIAISRSGLHPVPLVLRHPAPDQRVLVVDERGRPAPGIPIRLRRHAPPTGDVYSFTGEDGSALLRRPLEAKRLEADVLLPFNAPTPISIDTTANSAHPTLRLPPMGWLEVTMSTPGGSALPGPRTVKLTSSQAADQPAPVSRWSTDDETLRIPVGVGSTIDFECTSPLHLPWSVEGPRASGGIVRADIVAGDRHVAVQTRLLMRGEPVASRSVTIHRLDHRLRGPHRHTMQGTTDANGALVFALDARKNEVQERRLVIELLDARGNRWSAPVSLPGVLSVGLHDLGPLALEPQPVLVSGQVVDSRGNPIEHAVVKLHRDVPTFPARASGGPSSLRLIRRFAAVYTDAEGRFEWSGQTDDSSLFVLARRGGFVASADQQDGVACTPGTRDLLITLSEQSIVTGQVSVGEALDFRALEVVFRHDAPNGPVIHRAPLQAARDGTTAAFQISLPPNRLYDLELQVTGPAGTVVLGSFQANSGPHSLPTFNLPVRLFPVQLRVYAADRQGARLVRPYTLTFPTKNGTPSTASAIHVDPSGGEHRWCPTLYATSPTCDITVTLETGVTKTFRGVRTGDTLAVPLASPRGRSR